MRPRIPLYVFPKVLEFLPTLSVMIIIIGKKKKKISFRHLWCLEKISSFGSFSAGEGRDHPTKQQQHTHTGASTHHTTTQRQ